MNKFIIIIFILFASNLYAGSSCSLSDILKNKEIANNPEFWEDYAKINPADEKAIEKLTQKYSADNKKESLSSQNVDVSSNADFIYQDKKIENKIKSNPGIKKKYEEFISLLKENPDMRIFYKQAGKWRLEKMTHDYNFENTYTVRLNDGYRVLFTKLKDGTVQIIEVDKSTTHSTKW